MALIGVLACICSRIVNVNLPLCSLTKLLLSLKILEEFGLSQNKEKSYCIWFKGDVYSLFIGSSSRKYQSVFIIQFVLRSLTK